LSSTTPASRPRLGPTRPRFILQDGSTNTTYNTFPNLNAINLQAINGNTLALTGTLNATANAALAFKLSSDTPAANQVAAQIVGRVTLNVTQPDFSAFKALVVTNNSSLQLNAATALGGGNSTTPTSVDVKSGGLVDLGTGSSTNAGFSTSINGNMTFEAGSELRLNTMNSLPFGGTAY